MSRKRREEGNETEVASSDTRTRKQAVKKSGYVVLDGGDQRILVKNVEPLGRAKYRGVIYGFSPSFVQEYRGLKVGDDLLFDADDIIKTA